MMRGDDPDWFDVRVNMPVQTGDRLYEDDVGRAELEFGRNFFVRLDSTTGMDILELSTERSYVGPMPRPRFQVVSVTDRAADRVREILRNHGVIK